MIREEKKVSITKKLFERIAPHEDQIKSLVVEMLRKMNTISEEEGFTETEEASLILTSTIELMICGLLLMLIRAPESMREEVTNSSLQSISNYIKDQLAIRLPQMELCQN